MSLKDLIDPEIAPIFAALPLLDIADLPKARDEYHSLIQMMMPASSDPLDTLGDGYSNLESR